MTISEMKICDDTLRYGKILDDREYITIEGVFVRQYTIEYENEVYILVKNNGEWVDFTRIINFTTHDLESEVLK